MSAFALTTLALVLAGTVGTFSVIGLREFAPGAALAVTILGATVEVAKLVIAAWLKSAWSTMPRWMRATGIGFILVIMALTALGTFAFLTAAHGSQAADRDVSTLALQGAEDRLALHQQALAEARKEELALQAEYDAFLAVGKISRAQGARQADADQLDEIRRRIDREQAAVELGRADRATAQQAIIAATVELGPVKALADLIGGSEISAVNLFIGLLMIAFDPLAVWLSIAASHAAKLRGPVSAAIPTVDVKPIAPQAVVAEAVLTEHAEVMVPPAEPAAPMIVPSAPVDAGALEEKKRGGRPKGAKDKAPRKRNGNSLIDKVA